MAAPSPTAASSSEPNRPRNAVSVASRMVSLSSARMIGRAIAHRARADASSLSGGGAALVGPRVEDLGGPTA